MLPGGACVQSTDTHNRCSFSSVPVTSAHSGSSSTRSHGAPAVDVVLERRLAAIEHFDIVSIAVDRVESSAARARRSRRATSSPSLRPPRPSRLRRAIRISSTFGSVFFGGSCQLV